MQIIKDSKTIPPGNIIITQQISPLEYITIYTAPKEFLSNGGWTTEIHKSQNSYPFKNSTMLSPNSPAKISNQSNVTKDKIKLTQDCQLQAG